MQKFNEAFAKSDSGFILDNITEDVKWTIIGDKTVEGKEAFAEALKEMEMDTHMELKIDQIITHGKHASANGELKMPGETTVWAFCDVYTFSGFKNPRIKEMTSYIVEVKAV